MPKYYDDHYEDCYQDWEEVIFRKDITKLNPKIIKTETTIAEKIFVGRKKQNLTAHEFSQLLHIPVKLYMKIESGTEIPNELVISKLKKYIQLS